MLTIMLVDCADDQRIDRFACQSRDDYDKQTHAAPSRKESKEISMNRKVFAIALAAGSIAAGAAFAQGTNVSHPMGFFVTSVGLGDGANLGGPDGADAHCSNLATAAGAGDRDWRAYLSTQEDGKRGVSARSRIGQGPWYNANGELIASDLDQLHILPNLYYRTAVDENGNNINGRGDKPNEHDILTGTQADGTAYFPWQEGDKTCSNWTSNGEGSATVGHHDRHGEGNTSWNAAHGSRGCSAENLRGTYRACWYLEKRKGRGALHAPAPLLDF